jgi:hypothetical protein
MLAPTLSCPRSERCSHRVLRLRGVDDGPCAAEQSKAQGLSR